LYQKAIPGMPMNMNIVFVQQLAAWRNTYRTLVRWLEDAIGSSFAGDLRFLDCLSHESLGFARCSSTTNQIFARTSGRTYDDLGIPRSSLFRFDVYRYYGTGSCTTALLSEYER
jgi:hypothetical protein